MFGASVIDQIHPTLLALKVKDQVLKCMVAENLEAVRKKRRSLKNPHSVGS